MSGSIEPVRAHGHSATGAPGDALCLSIRKFVFSFAAILQIAIAILPLGRAPVNSPLQY